MEVLRSHSALPPVPDLAAAGAQESAVRGGFELAVAHGGSAVVGAFLERAPGLTRLFAPGSLLATRFASTPDAIASAWATRLRERAEASSITRDGNHHGFHFPVAGKGAGGTVLFAVADRMHELVGPYVRAGKLDVSALLADAAAGGEDSFALGVIAALALEGRPLHEQPLTLQEKLTAAAYIAALELHAAAIFFNASNLVVLDNRLWFLDVSGEVPFFRVRPEVGSSRAMENILQTPDAHCYECNAGLHAVRMLALLRAVGPEAFDRAFPSVALGRQEFMPQSYWRTMTRHYDPEPAAGDVHFEVGAWIAYVNPDAAESISSSWNALCLGKLRGERVVWAMSNGPRLRTEDELVAMMRTLRTEGATAEPFLTGTHRPFVVEAVADLR